VDFEQITLTIVSGVVSAVAAECVRHCFTMSKSQTRVDLTWQGTGCGRFTVTHG